MARFFNENLILKLISLAAAIVMWVYVTTERSPVPVTKQVAATITPIGQAPPDVIVRLQQQPVMVMIQGPRSEVDNVGDGDVKAEFNLAQARVGMTTLVGRPYKMPASAPDVTAAGRPQIPLEVVPKVTRTLKIQEFPVGGAERYGPARLSPDFAAVSGSMEAIKKVYRLEVIADAKTAGTRTLTPIRAVDKDNIDVPGVEVQPPATTVELTLESAAATKMLIVSVPHRGQVAYPYQVTDIVTQPTEVVVSGKPDVLVQMTHVSTEEIDLSGLISGFTRDVPLQLPTGVTAEGGVSSVRVTVRVRDTTKTEPSGP